MNINVSVHELHELLPSVGAGRNLVPAGGKQRKKPHARSLLGRLRSH
jgi:hypothetical protein